MHYQVVVIDQHERRVLHVDATNAAMAVVTAMAQVSTSQHPAELVSVLPESDERVLDRRVA